MSPSYCMAGVSDEGGVGGGGSWVAENHHHSLVVFLLCEFAIIKNEIQILFKNLKTI